LKTKNNNSIWVGTLEVNKKATVFFLKKVVVLVNEQIRMNRKLESEKN